jgi:hypothetical protein
MIAIGPALPNPSCPPRPLEAPSLRLCRRACLRRVPRRLRGSKRRRSHPHAYARRRLDADAAP